MTADNSQLPLYKRLIVSGLARIVRAAYGVAYGAVAVVALPVLTVVAGASRGRQDALIWGCTPLINNRYWARAFAEINVKAFTLMTHHYSAFERSDFDLYFGDLLPIWLGRGRLAALVKPYIAAAYILRHARVFHTSFEGGALSSTPLRRCESWLLRCAGVRTVVSVFGGDAYMPSQIQNIRLRNALITDYPMLGRRERETRRRVFHWSQHADCVLTGFLTEGMPRWDCPIVSQLTIDTKSWAVKSSWSEADGVNAPVRILHTPNHRAFKGTEFILAAMRELEARGLAIELVLLEGVKNTEIRASMQTCDILVEQMVFTGYALSAIEGMASGLCVISNLEDDNIRGLFRDYSYLGECPIVSAGAQNLADTLEVLVRNPVLRRELGQASRAYVEKYHSYEAARVFYGAVHDKILGRRDVDLMNFFHPLKSSQTQALTRISHPLVDSKLPPHLTRKVAS